MYAPPTQPPAPQQRSIRIETGGVGTPAARYQIGLALSTVPAAEQKAIYYSRDTYVACSVAFLLKLLMIMGSLVSGGQVLGFVLLAVLWVEPTLMLLVWLKHPALRLLTQGLAALHLCVNAAYLATWAALYYWDVNVGRFTWWSVTSIMLLHTGFLLLIYRSVVNVQHGILMFHMIKSHIKSLTTRLLAPPPQETPIVTVR